jgi:hypothetical protein
MSGNEVSWETIDQAAMAAIVRLLPGAEIVQQGTRSRAVPDFLVR